MIKYWEYLLYILRHKKNVGIECIKDGLYIHAITHDLSKFRPSEFIPYARFFYSTDRANNYKKSDEDNSDFKIGWLHHQKRNKHHWNYWVSTTENVGMVTVPMPITYILQMICDWKGMSRKFGGTWQEYYDKNKHRFYMHEETIKLLEDLI